MLEQYAVKRKQGNAPISRQETQVFPVETLYPYGFAGYFMPPETRETGFAVGGRVAHKNYPKLSPEYTRTPAPRTAGKSRGPENGGLSVSLVSFVRESEYPCGFPGGSHGKRLCCHVFPLLPVVRSDQGKRYSRASSPAGNSRREFSLGCWVATRSTLRVTK